jgi:hypothetical protein
VLEPEPEDFDDELPELPEEIDDAIAQQLEEKAEAKPKEVEAKQVVAPAPVEEPEEDESPAFFTITDEHEPEDEPTLAELNTKPEELKDVSIVLPGVFDELDDDLEEPGPAEEKPAPVAKARVAGKGQPELSFEGGPRGKFEGASPSLFEGEDLDVPAFLRKKR